MRERGVSVLSKVARVGKPHGIRGENTVQVFSADVRLAEGQELMGTFDPTIDPGSQCFGVTVASVRRYCGSLLVRFEGIDSRNKAEGLRGTHLFTDVAEEGPADEDTWYEHQLLGFRVYDHATGNLIGVVSGLRVLPVQDLLIVKNPAGKEAMIPFVKELVLNVDQPKQRITVSLPGGLLDVNP